MKAMSKKQFRMILILYVLTLGFSAAAGVLDSTLLPHPLLDLQRSMKDKNPSLSELVLAILGIPGMIGWFIAVIGLYRFWKPARWMGIAAWLYMLVWMSISPGPVISNVVAASFSQSSTFLAGAVLAISFFSPAAEWFEKKKLFSEPTHY